jgi:hypothetical protein
MRVSANENDPGYANFAMATANGKKVSVFLDGEEIRSCVTADDELGFVVRMVLDDKGLCQIDPIETDQAWTERVTGVVEIRFTPSEEDAA